MIAYDSLSDIKLVNLIKLNDHLAFTELYHRFYGLLFIHACKISRDKIVAQDLVQDIFIHLWDKRHSIHFTTSVSSYLYSSIRYKFFNLIDRQKVRLDYIQAFQAFIDKGEYLTDNYIVQKELSAIIEKEIDKLPAKMREIFVLSRQAHLSNRQIAEKLNISEKTVKNQLSNALKILRIKLGLVLFVFLLIEPFQSVLKRPLIIHDSGLEPCIFRNKYTCPAIPV